MVGPAAEREATHLLDERGHEDLAGHAAVRQTLDAAGAAKELPERHHHASRFGATVASPAMMPHRLQPTRVTGVPVAARTSGSAPPQPTGRRRRDGRCAAIPAMRLVAEKLRLTADRDRRTVGRAEAGQDDHGLRRAARRRSQKGRSSEETGDADNSARLESKEQRRRRSDVAFGSAMKLWLGSAPRRRLAAYFEAATVSCRLPPSGSASAGPALARTAPVLRRLTSTRRAFAGPHPSP